MSQQPAALVTGTSTGIGMHAAVQLAQAGHKVVATMRTPAKAEALRALAAEAGVTIDIRALDVTDDAEARAVVAAVLAEYGRVDVLVNNAGQGLVGTLEQLVLDDLRAQIELNYIGVARMTQLVLPVMRSQGGGRVITVTSVGGVVGQPFNDAYCASKFATEGLMESLAPAAATFGVLVSLVEPGPVATEFVANISDDARAKATTGDYAPLFGKYMKRVTGAFAQAQAASAVAAVVVEACTTATPRFRYQTSEGSAAFVGVKLADLDGSSVQAMTGSWIA